METNSDSQNVPNKSIDKTNEKLQSNEIKQKISNKTLKIEFNQPTTENKEKIPIRLKNQRFSADLDLIKNNLIQKNYGFTNEINQNTPLNNLSQNLLPNQSSSQKQEKPMRHKISDNFLNELSTSQKIKMPEGSNMNISILTKSLGMNSSSNVISAAYINKTPIISEKINNALSFKPEEILRKIFLIQKNGNLSFLISNIREIEKLLYFLLNSKNQSHTIHLIEFLKQSFSELSHNIDIFTQIHIDINEDETSDKKKMNLYHILINLINNPDINYQTGENFLNLILTTLEIMARQANCSKENLEIVYQEFSKLFFKSKNCLVCPHKGDFLGTSNQENKEKVSLIIKKNISILKSLYSKCFYVEKPYNYFYFNGSDYLRVKERSLNDEKINLKDGVSLLFWVKIDFVNSKELNLNNNLINIKCQKNFNINILILENQILIRNHQDKDGKEEKICSHDHEFFSNNPNNNNYTGRDWIFIGVTFKKKNSKKAIIKFYINNTSNELPSENFDFDNEIQEINLFNKFCGFSTSFMLFEGVVDEKQMELIKENKKGSDKFYGFYSESKLNKFLRKINSKHLENSDFEKYNCIYNINQNENQTAKSSKNKQIPNINTTGNYEILRDLMSKNLKIFYSPMRKKDRTIYDITNSYHANFATYETFNFGLCGSRNFHNFQKNIFLLGGINNIIPILELMWLSNTYKENFTDYMELIAQILFEREKNMKDAIEKSFFQIISIFFEKFDKEIYDERLLSIFKDLLKHFFSCVGKNDLCKIFLDNILLNLKILLKFEIELQIEIWKTLYQCYVSDPTEINRFMNIKTLSSIIVEYDKTHYYEYCCEDHKNNFISNEEISEIKSVDVMKPTLNEKIKHILMILNLMLKEFDIAKNASDLKNFKNFIKLLILDISPCLQKGIITVLIEFFRKITPSSELILEQLIKSNLIEYLLFNYSISLVDIRCFILGFFKVIMNYKIIKENDLNKFEVNDKIVPFIFENLFPTNLKAFKKDVLNSPERNRGLGIYTNKGFHKGNTFIDYANSIKKFNLDAEKKEAEDVYQIKSAKNSSSTKFNFNIKSTMLKLSTDILDNYISKSNDKIKLSTNLPRVSHIEETEESDFVLLNFKEEKDIEDARQNFDKNFHNKKDNQVEINEIKQIQNEESYNNQEDDDLNNQKRQNSRNFRSPIFDNKLKEKNEEKNEKNIDKNNNIEEGLETPIENPFDSKNSIIFSYRQNITSEENSPNKSNDLINPLFKSSSNFKLELNQSENMVKNDLILKINQSDPNLEKNSSGNISIEKDVNRIDDFHSKSSNINKLNKLHLYDEEEDTTGLSADNSNYSIVAKPITNNIKNKIAGFSGLTKRNTMKISENRGMKLGLDIEAINEKYQFGGDKHKLNITDEESQKNFEEKIKMLAEHCVKFMNGEVNEIKCLDFSSDIFFREKEIENENCQQEKQDKLPGLYYTEKENNHMLPNQPNTMRGLHKINFNYTKDLKTDKIENVPVLKEDLIPGIDTPLVPMKLVLDKNKKKKMNFKGLKIKTQSDENENEIENKNLTEDDNNSNSNNLSKKSKIYRDLDNEKYSEIKEENENENEHLINDKYDEEKFLRNDTAEEISSSSLINSPAKENKYSSRKGSDELKLSSNQNNSLNFSNEAAEKNLIIMKMVSGNSENQLKKPPAYANLKKKNLSDVYNYEDIKTNLNEKETGFYINKKDNEITPIEKKIRSMDEAEKLTDKSMSEEEISRLEKSPGKPDNSIQNDKNNYDNLTANDLEDLSIYFHKENYSKYIHILFNCCLQLMTNKEFNEGLFPIFSDKFNFSNLLSDFENYSDKSELQPSRSFKMQINKKLESQSPLIVNPDFLNILIKITQMGNFSYTYRLLIELQVLIHENENNSKILACNNDFNSWFIEIIFNCYWMYKSQKMKIVSETYNLNNIKFIENKNPSCFVSDGNSLKTNENKNDNLILDNFLNEINSIFVLGKKINTKIFSDLFSSLKDNPIKKLNFLLNWGYHMKIYKTLEFLVDEYTINDFIRNFLEDIYDTVKEYLIPSKDILKEAGSLSQYIINSTNWDNFAAFAILVYEFMTFFNSGKNPKFFSFENDEINMIPQKIIKSLNLKTNRFYEEGRISINEPLVDFESGYVLIDKQKENNNRKTSHGDVLFELDNKSNNENKFNEQNEKESNNTNNIHLSREEFNINNEWADYSLFYKIYQFISKIWSETGIFIDKVDKKSTHLRDDYLINEYILNKSQRDLFLDNIKFLFYTNSWNNDFLNPNFINTFNQNNKSHNYFHPKKNNSYFHESINKFNIVAPNYKNNSTMLSLHIPIHMNNTPNINSTYSGVNQPKDNLSSSSNFMSTKDIYSMQSSAGNNTIGDSQIKENLTSSSTGNNNTNNMSFNSYNIYDIPLIKVMNNFLVMSINLSKEINSFKNWVSEYEKFLTFLIFASSNLLKDNSEGYTFYQDNIIDILLFGISFFVKLIDELNASLAKNESEKQKSFQKNICEQVMFYSESNQEEKKEFLNTISLSLKKTFGDMVKIYVKIYEQIQKKKKKINFFTNLISSKKEDLSQCAVYRFFTEIFVDQRDQMLLNNYEIETHMRTFFNNLETFFKKENVIKKLFFSPNIKERTERIFDLNIYMNVLKIRGKLSDNYTCIEMNQLLKPRRNSMRTLLQDLKFEKNKVFGKAKGENFEDMALSVEKKLEKSFSLMKNQINAFEIGQRQKKSFDFDAEISKKFLISDQNFNKIVFNTIEKSIQAFISDIKELESQELSESKNKKLIYKTLKKKFFSWRGFWADKDLFFKKPELLKYKTLNHYTSNFSRPFLIHILDLEYHLPKFTSFNPKNLLLDNNKNCDYHICLDIGKILNSGNPNSNSVKVLQIENKSKKFPKKSIKKTTYIFDIYKLTSKNIWKSYMEINLLHHKYQLNPEEEYFSSITEKFLQRKTSIIKNVPENLYDCCYVKKSHHIKGIFQINKEGITFRLNQTKINNSIHTSAICLDKENSNDDIGESMKKIDENKTTSFNLISKSSSRIDIDILDFDLHYDDQRKTCVGSYITYQKKDLDKLVRNFPYDDMRFILKRNYYLRKSGLEIFVSNQSYYFNFKSQKDRDCALKEILKKIEFKKEIRCDNSITKFGLSDKDNVIGYENLLRTLPNYSLSQIKKFVKTETITTKIENWSQLKISNFEILMWMNILSNRSYSDISQYPVFPWILKNYNKAQLNNDISKDLRELDKPMGMMCIDDKGKGKERATNYKEMYYNTKDDYLRGDSPSLPYFYGHTYSNPMYVTHYLTRIFPYAQIAVELQGSGFDDPNRMFLSLENSFYCSTTQKGDVREIIPEFFFLPEMFYNFNNINFGERIFSNNEKTTVNEVGLPPWAEGQGYKFVAKLREILESSEVSETIAKWMDLIFGYKQRGKEAEECSNVFLPSAYGLDGNLDDLDRDIRTTSLTMVEIGLVPLQITAKEFTKRLTKDYVRNGKQITESNDLKLGRYTEIIQTKNKSGRQDKKVMVQMKFFEEDRNLICVFGNNQIFSYKQNSDTSKTFDNFNYQDSLFKIQNKNFDLYNETTQNCPIVLYGKGKYLACGGYWDGGIRVINLDNSSKYNVTIYSTVDFPNICLTIDKDEKYAFTGSSIGIVSVFRIYEKENKWTKLTDLFDHYREITSIFISNTLNILATSCIDGFVNLYTFPVFGFLRSIKLTNNYSADYVFLSNSPLPCVSIFSKSNLTFYNFCINGKKMNVDVHEEKGLILSPQVFTDISFNDFLIYGTNTGYIRVRKFPELNLHKTKMTKSKKNRHDEIHPIKCIDLTDDKKSIFLWTCENSEINIISDPSETSEAATHNLISMGLG